MNLHFSPQTKLADLGVFFWVASIRRGLCLIRPFPFLDIFLPPRFSWKRPHLLSGIELMFPNFFPKKTEMVAMVFPPL